MYDHLPFGPNYTLLYSSNKALSPMTQIKLELVKPCIKVTEQSALAKKYYQIYEYDNGCSKEKN